jgi:HK97 family phage prohead protease
LGFIEVLERGAFASSLRKGDQVLLWQHDTAQPLARRSAGNLTLEETERGLEFTAELPNTSLAVTPSSLSAPVSSGVCLSPFR